MKYHFVNGHAIPPDEMTDHLTESYCVCNPIPILDLDGTLWFEHNRLFRVEHLIEAAEAIKAATSTVLHQNAELKGLKTQLYPYGMKKIYLPQTGNRSKGGV